MSSTNVENQASPRPKGVAQIATISNPSAVEGNDLIFDVSFNQTLATSTMVRILTLSGTGIENVDYASGLRYTLDGTHWYTIPTTGEITVPVGTSAFKVAKSTLTDNALEGSGETVRVSVQANDAMVVGTGTIIDPPRIASVANVTVNEGDDAVLAVSLSHAAPTPTAVNIAIENGTALPSEDYQPRYAVSVNGGPYTAINGSEVLIPGGLTEFLVKVLTIEDSVFESVESFTVTASTGGTSGTGNVVILNDDSAPKVQSVSAASAEEGNGLVFDVAMTNASSTNTIIELQLSAGTAQVGSDYMAAYAVSTDNGATWRPVSGSQYTLEPLQTQFKVRVLTVEDDLSELTETFTLRATANNGGASATGTITDDDIVYIKSISTAQAVEGQKLTFDIALTTPVGPRAIELSLSTLHQQTESGDLSAVYEVSSDNGASWRTTQDRYSLNPGVSAIKVRLASVDDSIYESDETFALRASLNGRSVEAQGTIIDNDDMPAVASVVGNQSIEGSELSWAVYLDRTSSTETSVAVGLNFASSSAQNEDLRGALQYSTNAGGAWHDVENGTVPVPAGQREFWVRQATRDDSDLEGRETLALTARTDTGSTQQGMATILDNDASPVGVSDVSQVTGLEGNYFQFRTSLTGETRGETRIRLSVQDAEDMPGWRVLQESSFDEKWSSWGAQGNIDGLTSRHTGSIFHSASDGHINRIGEREQLDYSTRFTTMAYGADGRPLTGYLEIDRYGEIVVPNGTAFLISSVYTYMDNRAESIEVFFLSASTVDSENSYASSKSGAGHIQSWAWEDPLIVDLNGDGVQTTALADSQAQFDLNNDGVTERSGWISGEDAFLAIDTNADGIINNRDELFGDAGVGGGFRELAALDSNADRVVDQNDPAFGQLRLWRDADGDGSTDAGELIGLSEVGLLALEVSFRQDGEIQGGNLVLERGSAQFEGGITRDLDEAYFEIEQSADEVPPDRVDLSTTTSIADAASTALAQQRANQKYEFNTDTDTLVPSGPIKRGFGIGSGTLAGKLPAFKELILDESDEIPLPTNLLNKDLDADLASVPSAPTAKAIGNAEELAFAPTDLDQLLHRHDVAFSH